MVVDGWVERGWSPKELSLRRWERGPDGIEEVMLGAAGGDGARSSGVTSPGFMKT